MRTDILPAAKKNSRLVVLADDWRRCEPQIDCSPEFLSLRVPKSASQRLELYCITRIKRTAAVAPGWEQEFLTCEPGV